MEGRIRKKVDEYEIASKHKKYRILVFPKPDNMWAVNTFAEDGFVVDGDRSSLELLKVAFAVLASDFTRIIYFPIKNAGIGDFYMNNYHLVLLRPELQFRRSEWFILKSKLDKRHWTGRYRFTYNRQKLDAYWKKISSMWTRQEPIKRNRKLFVQEILGDVIFMVIPREDCYELHADLAKWLDTGVCECGYWLLGYLYSDECIQKMVCSNNGLKRGG